MPDVLYKKLEAKLYSATGLGVRTLLCYSWFLSSLRTTRYYFFYSSLLEAKGVKKMKNNNKSISEILSEISDDEKIEFEEKWKGMLKGWKKNTGKKVKSSLVMRIWKEIEELVWLGISVGILVIVLKFIFFLGF